MNSRQSEQTQELIAILWKLKNAAAQAWPRPVNLHELLHDSQFRSRFLEKAANSPFSEIRYAASRAQELDRRQPGGSLA